MKTLSICNVALMCVLTTIVGGCNKPAENALPTKEQTIDRVNEKLDAAAQAEAQAREQAEKASDGSSAEQK